MRTPLVSGLAASSMGLVLLALAMQSWQVVLLALPPIIVLALGSLSPPPSPRLLAVRTLSQERTDTRREVDVEVVVRNAGPALDLVEIVDILPASLEVVGGTNHGVLSLEAGGTARLAYAVRGPVKGDFVIGPVRARSFDPLGLGVEDAVIDLRSRLVVAPTTEDLRRGPLQPRRTRPWFGQVASRRIGAGTEFWGIREYLPGDEVRRINWKASARFDRLLTNEYEGERTADVVIVVDARREALVGSETDNPIEHSVRAALGIADRVLAAKNRVGLIVQRQVIDWVPLAFGRKQLYRILEHLIHVTPGGDWPFSYVSVVLSRFFPRNSLVVLITPLQDRGALGAVTDLVARGYDVAVVSPSGLEIERRLRPPAETDQVAYRILLMERANRIAQLRRVAQVVDWDPAQPLALALRRTEAWPRPA